MATPHKFRFYIYRVISGIAYYYAVSSGVVTSTTAKDGSQLGFSPTDWDEIEKTWSRSRSLHGIINKLSDEYEFWGDGGKILKHLVFTYGYDVKAKLLVEIRRDSDWLYETYSDNDIKMSKPKTSIDGVSVELFDSGMASDFMANLDTPYEIPLSGSDVITVEHEGTTVLSKYNYRYGASSCSNATIRTIQNEWFCLLTVPTGSEGMRPVAAEQGASPIRMGEMGASSFYGIGDPASDQYTRFILASSQLTSSVVVAYKSKLRFRLIPSGIVTTATNSYIQVRAITTIGQFFIDQTTLYTGSTIASTTGAWVNEDIDVSATIPALNDGYFVYIVVGVYTDPLTLTAPWGWEIETVDEVDSRISLSFEFNSPPSNVEGFRLYKLAQKTVEAFADGKYGSTPFSSNFLSNPSSWMKGVYPYRTIITNGNAIKGITDSVFKLSMKDIIDDVQANFGLGVGVSGNQLQIEPIATFYDDSVLIADLGELTDVEITPINEVPTLLVFGHKFNNDNDVLNGALDYNTKSTFKSANITDLNSKKEYVSPIVSSIYSIEKIRVSEYGKDTTGNKINEDLYKLGVVETAVGGKYKINYEGSTGGGLFVAVNTLDNPYNVEFSPKNMWLRLKEIINSNAYPSTTEITFQKSDRYKDMQTLYYDIDTASYTSFLKEDEGFSPDGTDLIWLPFDIKCKVILPSNLDALLTANPYGKFKGTYKGVEVHFFLNEARQKPSNQNSFDMEGRLTPSTNILDLIF